MISIAVAWGLYLFSGSHSLTVWLAMLMFSAGVGAGAGSLLAWMQLDRGTDSKRMVTVISVVVIGVLSAWLGYHYGSNREIECCAISSTTPIYYTAIGATIGTNIALIAIFLMRKIFQIRVGTRIQNGVV